MFVCGALLCMLFSNWWAIVGCENSRGSCCTAGLCCNRFRDMEMNREKDAFGSFQWTILNITMFSGQFFNEAINALPQGKS